MSLLNFLIVYFLNCLDLPLMMIPLRVKQTFTQHLNYKILHGGRFRSHDPTHSESCSNLEKNLLQMQCFLPLVRILRLNSGEDQNKRSLPQNRTIFGRKFGFLVITGYFFVYMCWKLTLGGVGTKPRWGDA